jgi:hypothetical protein
MSLMGIVVRRGGVGTDFFARFLDWCFYFWAFVRRLGWEKATPAFGKRKRGWRFGLYHTDLVD